MDGQTKLIGETGADDVISVRIPMPHNALEGYGNGCLLDLRVRLAVDLLKSSPIFDGIVADGLKADKVVSAQSPSEVARYALDLATELLSFAAARGLVEPLPSDNGELTPELRAQARRTASYQALQQMEAQKFVADEQGRVVPTTIPSFPQGTPRRSN